MLGKRYVLTDHNRQGGQATVTQAFDIQTRRSVAIKRVRFGPDDARAQEGFQREAGMLQDLRHKHIVEWLETDRDADGNWYLVLEWVDDNLESLIERDGPISWGTFWERIGRDLLDAVAYGQKRRIAHRDIKPKNILVTVDGKIKLADYGIAKLLDDGGSWKPVSGFTFRFDHTAGYTPSKPDEAQHLFSRDCFAFAAVALSCITGRIFDSDQDLDVALVEATLPKSIRPILERCLSPDASKRPPLASVLFELIEQAQEAHGPKRQLGVHLVIGRRVRIALERRLGTENPTEIETYIKEDLEECCAILLKSTGENDEVNVNLVGASWRFDASISGREGETLELTHASEIGAGLASELRDSGLNRSLRLSFGRPMNAEEAGQQLKILLVEAQAFEREIAAERAARATQRIFRVWRSYLRDRADLEARRSNAIKYMDRKVASERVVFTTELAQGEDLIGQDRLVQYADGRVGGKISGVAFNQITMDVTFGDAQKLPRRGDIAINTIAAQRALAHQTHALDAVMFDRSVNNALKTIILDPRTASPVLPVTDVIPTDESFDGEKLGILSRALGVQDILAIEGPPGTGKTKLITEIVVQWMRRNPSHRILLSSQTHIALDNVLERVTELDPSLEIIRIGKADEPKISEQSKQFLLSRRVESWIADIRKASEEDLERWAKEVGVDQQAVSIGVKVERLIQVLKRQEETQDEIAKRRSEKDGMDDVGEDAAKSIIDEELKEETTQLDSEIGAYQQELKRLRLDERRLRDELRDIGDYAAALADSKDNQELAEWALHFLEPGPLVNACRERLSLLEDWQLRVGRSPDFNAAMLSSAQIIAGTCVGIAGVQGMEDVSYDLCIIDEASKATPTEIMIPMARSERWIIVGDPKQLPPFFEDFGEDLLSQFDDAEVRATLLDRFLDEQAGLPSAARAELRNQYRMIKPIGDLVSECFYDKKLESPIETHGLKLSAAFPKAVTWYSTHLLPDRAEKPEGQTFRNKSEVAAIRKLLQRLQFVAKAQKKRISIAVIAGYTAQVADLREMGSQGVGEWPDLDVTCNSVDAFQGRQADVCIYSVVRSNNAGVLGFLREKPRLNVALSRGKSLLLIVGDQMFCRSAKGKNPFRRVIEYLDHNDETCGMEVLQ